MNPEVSKYDGQAFRSFALSLYFGCICAGVFAMWLVSRRSGREWLLWVSFLAVTCVLMGLLSYSGVEFPG
ncbi:hypothetical protein [Variovorax sp.]|jgi:hypothetical protein